MPSILDQIKELKTDNITLHPSNRDIEKRENTWALSLEPGDHRIDPIRISRALSAAGKNWLQRARSKYPRIRKVTFYAWYDEQAGQLRVSLTSQPPSRLPFGCKVRLVEKPGPIVYQMLVHRTPAHQPRVWIDNLHQAPDESEDEFELRIEQAFIEAYSHLALDVWAVTAKW